MIQIREVNYRSSEVSSCGYIAYKEEKSTKPKPAIMIFHDWGGRSELYCNKAREVAELGYIGFAVDMYGDATVVETTEEKVALLTPLKTDRGELLRRVQSAFDYISTQENVDSSQIIAIGYCFGGMCVLDLARSGAEVKGVVSFHGILEAPPQEQDVRIKSKVLVLHGYDDSLVKPHQMIEFTEEMTRKDVDWQVHIYGRTEHAFTHPQANDPVIGLKFNAIANARSWTTALNFFKEIIS